MANSQKVARIASLDSLRGAAALVVVFHHLLLIQPGAYLNSLVFLPFSLGNSWSWLYATPLGILVNGPGSVLVFFVLSGLVLTLTFVAGGRQKYLPFLIKRLMRIWPPFAVAILIAAAFQAVTQRTPPLGVSTWFFDSWNREPSFWVVAQHLDLTQLVAHHAGELDGPMWSLVHEFRASLIFPLIVFLAFRWPKLSIAGSIALMFVCSHIIFRGHRQIIEDFASSGIYGWLFVAGAVLAIKLQQLRAGITALPAGYRAAIWITAILLLMCARIGDVKNFAMAFLLLASGAGAVVIVAMCTLENAVTRFLETPIPTWLGKVSYSLYLIHMPVMFAIFYLFPRSYYILNAALSLLCALLLSEFLYRLVEAPSMRLGRYWSKQVLKL